MRWLNIHKPMDMKLGKWELMIVGEGPGMLQFVGYKKSDMTEVTNSTKIKSNVNPQ